MIGGRFLMYSEEQVQQRILPSGWAVDPPSTPESKRSRKIILGEWMGRAPQGWGASHLTRGCWKIRTGRWAEDTTGNR